MEILSNSILILSVIGILWYFLRMRRRGKQGEIVVPLFFATSLVFSLFVIGVILFGVSPFHLLWLFPLSFIVGTVLLATPVFHLITMMLLIILAIPSNWAKEETEQMMSGRKKRKKVVHGSKKKRK